MISAFGKFNLLQRSAALVAAFFADRQYFRQLFHFALPIASQNFITGSLNLVGVVVIGQLGDVPVAAVGLANQMFFLLQLVLFGITSGSAIFMAQLWGKQDIPNIRKVLCLCILLGLIAGVFFLALAQFAPEAVLSIYSKDPAVVAAGSEYLRIFSWAYLLVVLTFSFAAVLRSIGDVKTPMLISIFALGFNTVLSYCLILGKLGLPTMGVRGAAIAGLFARMVECGALLYIVYRYRPAVAVRLREFFALNLAFIGRVFKPILPVILNETFWSLGITAYSAIFARIGTDAIAAINIFNTIDYMAMVLNFGIANATAIMVGNRIGAGNEGEAYRYAGRSIIVVMLGGVMAGTLVLLLTPSILSLYKVSPQVILYAWRVQTIAAFFMWLRAANAVIIVGILRSGGDTRYSFFLDGVIIWVLGVPMAIFTAFVLDLPVYLVYLAVMSEEILKWVLGMRRYFSRRWIHNVTVNV
jgi:putative MATE family efflux protein